MWAPPDIGNTVFTQNDIFIKADLRRPWSGWRIVARQTLMVATESRLFLYRSRKSSRRIACHSPAATLCVLLDHNSGLERNQFSELVWVWDVCPEATGQLGTTGQPLIPGKARTGPKENQHDLPQPPIACTTVQDMSFVFCRIGMLFILENSCSWRAATEEPHSPRSEGNVAKSSL